MRRYNEKYTRELLTAAAARSRSIADVLRYLNIPWSGGTHAHISRRLKRLGIDTAHFQRAHNKGKPSPRRPTPDAALVVRRAGLPRLKPSILRRALREAGVPYVCAACGGDGTWRGKPLTLHVDHTDNFAGKGKREARTN